VTGTVLLTFDDRHLASWSAVAPLLAAQEARVTFFVREPDLLDATERRLLRGLADDGHTVGAHGLRHRDAVARTDALGAAGYLAEDVEPCVTELAAILGSLPRSFAYPMNRRDERTDRALLGVFSLLRAGVRRTGRPADAAGALVVPLLQASGTRRAVVERFQSLSRDDLARRPRSASS
jgi:peptidoglycan/xylan/chitin deacetylase (PgdA/CDA1 family)